MPIIQVDKKQTKTQIKTAIETDVQGKLRAYCRFCGATNDQVVSGALKFLFQSDAEFALWYETHKNDSQPRRGPRRRVLTEPNREDTIAIPEKALPVGAARR